MGQANVLAGDLPEMVCFGSHDRFSLIGKAQENSFQKDSCNPTSSRGVVLRGIHPMYSDTTETVLWRPASAR